MSEPRRRIVLAGATGMVGRAVMQLAVRQPALQLVALARREAPLPLGGRIEMRVADPAEWPDLIAGIAPDAAICALGTTWKQAGADETAFRAVDRDLVLAFAAAAKLAGTENFVFVSSVGANAHGKTVYLRVKGEVEAALAGFKFRRLDLLRPGLLRGARDESRPLERLAMLASPLVDLVLHGDKRRYRSIDARLVAAAALQCAGERAAGRFVHEHDGLLRAAKRLEGVG
jgi:uncharacterized protein YbjT (DUF2867 family)